MLGAVDLRHAFAACGAALLNVLCSLETVQQVVAQRLVKVEGDAGDDLVQ